MKLIWISKVIIMNLKWLASSDILNIISLESISMNRLFIIFTFWKLYTAVKGKN